MMKVSLTKAKKRQIKISLKPKYTFLNNENKFLQFINYIVSKLRNYLFKKADIF